MRRRLAWLMTLAACGGGTVPSPAMADANDWRRIATSADRQRLRQWRSAWVDALAQARRDDAAAIDAEGALFAFDRALADPLPPPGDYRCRVFKLGAKRAGASDYARLPWAPCRVGAAGGGHRSLTGLAGPQRATGTLFDGDGMRAVFLGTLMLTDERRPFAYGRDANRDLAGWMERVGPARWRLALPYPAFESTLDVIEVVPAA